MVEVGKCGSYYFPSCSRGRKEDQKGKETEIIIVDGDARYQISGIIDAQAQNPRARSRASASRLCTLYAPSPTAYRMHGSPLTVSHMVAHQL
jgi:hypothetical protein